MRLIILPLLLSACASFPELDGTISDTARQAPYPRLAPLPDTIDRAMDSNVETELAARIAALNARAERLRRIDIAALQ
ncbi:hypothetical protein [Yoonia sp. R2-816]|uniref:hypothetical protein n=1 Tax=Yoonia sp. R2-816 TaxID=3342638 RepID=UPI003729AFDC